MKRRAVIGISVVAVLALVALFLLARRTHLVVLTTDELGVKRLRIPAPPEDNCAQIQRALAGSSGGKLVRNTNPFDADEVAIYRELLEQWTSDSRSMLNVSDRTFPFNHDLSDCECLKGMEPQSLGAAARSFRILTRNMSDSKNIRLVNAARQAVIIQNNDPRKFMGDGQSVKTAVSRAFSTGLFSMSEIAFDKERRRALVSSSFVCGSLCGSGRIWMFEKIDGMWKKSAHVCGGWIS